MSLQFHRRLVLRPFDLLEHPSLRNRQNRSAENAGHAQRDSKVLPLPVITEKKIVDRLYGIDFCILVFGVAFSLLALNATLPQSIGHLIILMGLNLFGVPIITLATGYYNLSESRHSLGKGVLIAGLSWGMNIGLFHLLVPGPLTRMSCFSAIIFILLCGLSALIHYQLGQGFSNHNPHNLYYRWEQCLKRMLDLTLASMAMILSFPFLLFIPLLIRLESVGSPWFSQTRIGLSERTFKMYKFRSMRTDEEHAPVRNVKALYKRDDDPRLTGLGKWLRKLSLDELPQLFNVFRGEMSLVGPRPPIEAEYIHMNWHHRRKFEVLPGMTGLWQVAGRVRNQRQFNEVAAYDIDYIEHWCLIEDLKIILRTIPVVLLRKGAS